MDSVIKGEPFLMVYVLLALLVVFPQIVTAPVPGCTEPQHALFCAFLSARRQP
jgi:hypothetical protein